MIYLNTKIKEKEAIKSIIVETYNKKECIKCLKMNKRCFVKHSINYSSSENIGSFLVKYYKATFRENIDEFDCRITKGLAFVVENERRVFPNINSNFEKLLNHYYPDSKIVKIEFVIGIGGGNSAEIDGLCTITIHSNELHHKGFPHVHISKCNNAKKSVSVSLENLEIMEKTKNNKLFSRKEWNKIIQILDDNKELLIETYNKMVNGERFDSFELVDTKGEYTGVIFKA